GLRRRGLEAEEELGTREDELQGRLYTGVEVRLGARVAVEAHQGVRRHCVDGLAVREPCERGQNSLRAGFFGGGCGVCRGPAGEDLAARHGIAAVGVTER